MPELPEVETIRRQLEKLIVGRTISSIEVLNPGSFRADQGSLIGKTITKVDRRGKVLKIETGVSWRRQETPDQNLYIHLKMSGRLEFKKARPFLERPGLSKARHLRIAIIFTDSSCLLFHDQRKFGWITGDPAALPPGIDALDPSLSSNKLAGIIAHSSRPIKQILLDQSKIAGIGNIYVSEILWQAGISPIEKGRALPRQGSALIHAAIRKVLTDAIDYGGSTMADGLYRRVSGEAGDYWPRRRVYDREGEPCRRPACHKINAHIQKITIGRRSTYYCPSCQSS